MVNGILGNGVRWRGVSKELRDYVRWSRRRRWAQRAPVEIEERLQNAASVRTEETALVEREEKTQEQEQVKQEEQQEV